MSALLCLAVVSVAVLILAAVDVVVDVTLTLFSRVPATVPRVDLRAARLGGRA